MIFAHFMKSIPKCDRFNNNCRNRLFGALASKLGSPPSGEDRLSSFLVLAIPPSTSFFIIATKTSKL